MVVSALRLHSKEFPVKLRTIKGLEFRTRNILWSEVSMRVRNADVNGIWGLLNSKNLSQSGKADSGVTEIEDCVIVPHEGIAENPELTSNAGIGDNAADASA